jgi:hypothetical protein
MPFTRCTQSFLRTFTLCGVLLGLSTSGFAGTITYITTDFDLGSGWRTSGVPKTDIDPNDVLGTDGWFVAGDEGSTEIPAYLTSLISDGIVFGGDSGYASIDDPNTTPGLTPSLIQSGTLNPFPGLGGTTIDLTFTFGAIVPSVVQLGLMIDNLDIAAYNPDALQVIQVGGPGASSVVDTTGALYNDRVPDWVFFDIQPQPGETYEVIVTGGTEGCACLGAASFDSSNIPEPSSFSLAGLGAAFFAVAALRRFRRLPQR